MTHAAADQERQQRLPLSGLQALRAGPWPLLFLLLLSLTLKCFLLWCRGVYSPDSALYIAAAYHFDQGSWQQGLAIYPLPALSLLLALLHRLFGDWQVSAFFCSVVPAVLTLVPIYRIAHDLFDRRTAFWAAAAFALSPYLNKFGAELIRDPLFLCCFAWALSFAVRFLLTRRIRFLLYCILFYWASLLFRIDGVFFFLVLPLILAGAAWMQPAKRVVFLTGVGLWVAVPVVALLGLALLFPEKWLVVTQGDFIAKRVADILSLQFLDHYSKLYQGLQSIGGAESKWAGGLFPEMVSHYLVVLYGLLLIEYFLRVLYVPFALVLILGLGACWNRGRALVVASAAAFVAVSYLYLLQEGWIAKRYLSLLTIPAAPWVGRGMTRLLDLSATAPWKRPAAGLVMVGFFLLPVQATVSLGLTTRDDSIRQAAEWIASQTRWEQAKVYTTDNRLLLYAGRYADIPAWRSHGDLKDQLRSLTGSRKAVIVVIETAGRPFDEIFSALDEFTEMRYFKGRKRRVMVLYRKEEESIADRGRS